MGKLKTRQSYFFRLLMSILLVGVVPVIIFGICANVFTYSMPIKKLETELKQMAYKSNESLENMIESYKTILTSFSKDQLLIDALKSEYVEEYNRNNIYQKINTLLSGKVIDSDVYILKENGEFVISTIPENKIYSAGMKDWGIFRKLNATEDAFVYPNNYTTSGGKKISLSIAKRITMNQETLGYVILDIPWSTVEKALTVTGNQLDTNYLIMDDNFYIMYDNIIKNDKNNFFSWDFRLELLKNIEDIRIVNSGQRAILLFSLYSPENNLLLLAEVQVETILKNNEYIMLITSLMVAFTIILGCALTLLISHRISNPIKKIVQAMEKVEKGDINTKVEIGGSDDEIKYMANRFNEMVERLNDLFQKNMEKQDRLRISEIKSLQAQINPHFLYNTLDTIKWLAKLNGIEEISIIVSKLGNLLKNSINNNDDLITIEETMFLIDSYLSIQKIRFSDKFDVVTDIDESVMKCLVPKLAIQPVVENAIVHGIENKIGSSVVTIRGKRENDCIIFEVEDDGVGISQEKLNELRDSLSVENASENIALTNIHKRIKLFYGEKYGLEINSEKGHGTIVKLTMPAIDGNIKGVESNVSNRDR